jgi:hypothetical protein
LQSSHGVIKAEGNEALQVDELTNSTSIEAQQIYNQSS